MYATNGAQFKNTAFSEWYIMYIYGDATNRAVISECFANRSGFNFTINDYTDVLNVISNGGNYGVQLQGAGTIDGFYISYKNYGVLSQGLASGYVKFKNVSIKECVLGDTFIRCGIASVPYVFDFVDCKMTPERLTFYNSGAGVHRTTQNLITSLSGVIYDESSNPITSDVKIYDRDNNLLYTISAVDGILSTLEIVYFYTWREVAAGVTTAESSNHLSPFKIVVSKPGYQDLEIPGVTVTPGLPTVIRGQLVPEIPPVYVDRDIQGSVAIQDIQGSVAIQEIQGSVEVEDPQGVVQEINITGVIKQTSL